MNNVYLMDKTVIDKLSVAGEKEIFGFPGVARLAGTTCGEMLAVLKARGYWGPFLIMHGTGWEGPKQVEESVFDEICNGEMSPGAVAVVQSTPDVVDVVEGELRVRCCKDRSGRLITGIAINR